MAAIASAKRAAIHFCLLPFAFCLAAQPPVEFHQDSFQRKTKADGGKMKSKGLLFMAAFIISAFSVTAYAQNGQAYEDKDGKYKLSLYGDWRAVNYNDAVGRAKTE